MHWDIEEGRKMRMVCMGCGREVNLDHVIFDNYEGPVKCFSCGIMMEVKTVRGVLDSIVLQGATPVFLEKQPISAQTP
jgi:ribosomal protein S27E